MAVAEDTPAPRRELSDRWAHLIMAVLVIGALAGIVVAVMVARTGGDSTSQTLPEGVDRLVPTSGSEVLAQSTIGIDVAAGYQAYLVIDGETIKPGTDGMTVQTGTGLYQFTPGPGRKVEELTSGRNCVTAMVWKSEDTEAAAKPVNWCFDVT